MTTAPATAASTLQTFDTPTPISVVLVIPAGGMEFIASRRSDTVVEIHPADPAESRDVRAAEETTVDYYAGVLRIQSPVRNRILGGAGTIRVTVHLPAGSRIEARAAAAELRSSGPLGDVIFKADSSWIHLDEVANARLTTEAGDVQVGRLEGAVEIRTGKGHIRIDEALGGTVVLCTEYGSISVGVASWISAALEADTAYGRIHSALTDAYGAAVGLDIHATTGYGDITARSL